MKLRRYAAPALASLILTLIGAPAVSADPASAEDDAYNMTASIRMGVGYFSAAEGIVGDNIQHVIREVVTAPELKLVLGRHAHEENIHADSLLYMIS